MGFDNECISNIQSLPGEYFCPVCRTLVYPNEALQAQCTHLYCKPCLSYVVATTKACPYDGYLVTEADSKPLVESNKTLSETIGKVTVYCLYHKSGCQWHGTLSASIAHGTTCAYGNSPVICNRCGTQIVHRQVQEHAQLCHGLQSQAQQAGTQAQQPAATQAVTQDPSSASAGSAAATATTLPSSITATTATDLASTTVGAAGATPASTAAAAPPSFSAAPGSVSQTPTAEQSYQQQQLQYSQYYQQQHPGYNPYMQQYQQYGQYQQVYQQYPQPLQVPSQNMMQGSAQAASHVQPQVQSSQLPYMMQSQPQSQSQPQLQPSTGHPQLQQHPVQPQNQGHLSHLQVPAGQSLPHQPTQPAPQVPQLQMQLSGPQIQPAHTPAPTPVNQQIAIASTQATTSQVQPHVTAQPPQQQNAHLQALPPQQNPQMQLNYGVQLDTPQVQQQSYPQPQAYAQQTHHMHPQNASYPVQALHQQAPVSQHPVPMRPPVPGQQPAMLPAQGIQNTTQNQQHIGYHAQWPPMHSNIPGQAPQQGLPPHSSVSSQSVQPYQQGMAVSQQQVHSQSGQPYTQHIQTSAGRPGSHLALPQQLQHQQPSMPAAGQPIGQGSSDLETHASRSRKSEITSNAADNTAVIEHKNNGTESALMRPTTSQSLGDENMDSKQNGVGGVRKDPSGHISQQNAGRKDQSGQISQQNSGTLGSYVPPGMGQQQPSGPDVMIPQHMTHPGHKHGFSENVRPPLQQPYGLFHSGMTPRPLGENQIQMPMSQPGGVRHGDAMIRPHMAGPLPGHHDAMLPPFVEHLGQPPVSGRAFQEEGFNASGEHRRLRAAYPGKHDSMEDSLKQFPGPAHLDGHGLPTGPRPFERALGRPDGFLDSLQGRPPFPNRRSPFPVGPHEDFSRKPNTTDHPDFLSHGAEFDQHRADGMPIFRNPGPFSQGMSGGPHGSRQDQLGSDNLPGNLQHSFGGPEFPPARFNPGHMHPIDPNLVADYAHHTFPKESAHFGLGGPLRNGNIGWCRICMFNCGSAENLDLHVQTREHQQCTMDIVLKMKQDVAKRQKLNYGVPKSFHNKKVAGKGQFRGNRC